ncbi:hypothetical protein OHC33_004389 [Knufia fluminis]|uniref:Heterokaryon incompatibility domain-containing protein n=2 Tax=Knufia TaxID=430999 RepID=A0AAN8I9S2_9EURO|nr:hypothetical protein OHC33_004389 [Knufia fluminis]
MTEMATTQDSSKRGWQKITQTCRLAEEIGIDWVWVDTCCIDKSSSAELTEAINSMYQWYRGAKVCYVYLTDLEATESLETAHSIATCRWWRRGWTLQELIAPTRLEFYGSDWNYLASRQDCLEVITERTGIPANILDGSAPLNSVCIAARMSWAAGRDTTRIEDEAYSLLGIFEVNMPLIYGEGTNAFRRLQEEIVKRNSDSTIFAFHRSNALFATSASSFVGMERFERFPHSFFDFSVTNRGLRISGEVPLRLCTVPLDSKTSLSTLIQFLGYTGEITAAWGMPLRKIGPKLFQRHPRLHSLVAFNNSEVRQSRLFHATDVYIIIDWDPTCASLFTAFRVHAIHVPPTDAFQLQDAVPENLWDPEDRLFLKPRPYKWDRYNMVLAMRFSCRVHARLVNLIVLCDARTYPPKGKLVLLTKEDDRIRELLFRDSYRQDSISWMNLDLHVPSARELSDTVCVPSGKTSSRISVSLRQPALEPGSAFHVVFDVVEEQEETHLSNGS